MQAIERPLRRQGPPAGSASSTGATGTIPRVRVIPVVLHILLVLVAGHTPAEAATPLTRNEQAVINFGFATQLGSGIYSMSGRTLQVYRFPFGYRFPGDSQSRSRVRLTLPVTIGFIDFKPGDVVESGLPEGLDAVSFVPGIAVDVMARDDWQLEPFAEAGIARDQSGEMDQRVYSLGLRSRYDIERGAVGWQLYSEVVHVAVEQVSTEGTDDFTRLRLGATARRPFRVEGDGRRPDFLVYGLLEGFTDTPRGPADGGDGDLPVQAEFGMTFGATETLRLWGLPLPRIGIGYRFGEGLSVVRIVFGSPY